MEHVSGWNNLESQTFFQIETQVIIFKNIYLDFGSKYIQGSRAVNTKTGWNEDIVAIWPLIYLEMAI